MIQFIIWTTAITVVLALIAYIIAVSSAIVSNEQEIKSLETKIGVLRADNSHLIQEMKNMNKEYSYELEYKELKIRWLEKRLEFNLNEVENQFLNFSLELLKPNKVSDILKLDDLYLSFDVKKTIVEKYNTFRNIDIETLNIKIKQNIKDIENNKLKEFAEKEKK